MLSIQCTVIAKFTNCTNPKPQTCDWPIGHRRKLGRCVGKNPRHSNLHGPVAQQAGTRTSWRKLWVSALLRTLGPRQRVLTMRPDAAAGPWAYHARPRRRTMPNKAKAWCTVAGNPSKDELGISVHLARSTKHLRPITVNRPFGK